MSYPTLNTICRIVTEHFRVTRAELESPRRDAPLVRCRHVAIYLCSKLTRRSWPQIARYVHRDHSSCMSAKKKIARAILNDPDLATEVRQLEQKILACSELGAANYEGTEHEQKETPLHAVFRA